MEVKQVSKEQEEVAGIYTQQTPPSHATRLVALKHDHYLLAGGNSNIFHFHPENWGR